ncbi:MAG: tRNA pseudouridine38-40 synthase [Glaciecola sp.]|jgi:tRNA pseudouridine38-40 synthase
MKIKKYFFHLAYDGTNYHGWQFQPNAITVQEVIESKLKVLVGEKVSVMGCGRTDTGVHASDFYLHCELELGKYNEDELCYKLNHLIPNDVVIKKILCVKDDAHTRFDAISREYRYYINQQKNPFIEKYSYMYVRKVNLTLMREAGKLLLEHKDFTSFSKLHTDVNTNDCDVSKFEINELGDGKLEIILVANRFLRNMVRSIVGTLLDVGIEKISVKEFDDIIHSKNRSNAGASAPAKGLFLHKVKYPEGYFTER